MLDLRDVSFIEARGLALLVAAAERARDEEWRLSLRDGCPPVDRLLEITGLSSRFQRA